MTSRLMRSAETTSSTSAAEPPSGNSPRRTARSMIPLNSPFLLSSTWVRTSSASSGSERMADITPLMMAASTSVAEQEIWSMAASRSPRSEPVDGNGADAPPPFSRRTASATTWALPDQWR